MRITKTLQEAGDDEGSTIMTMVQVAALMQ